MIGIIAFSIDMGPFNVGGYAAYCVFKLPAAVHRVVKTYKRLHALAWSGTLAKFRVIMIFVYILKNIQKTIPEK